MLSAYQSSVNSGQTGAASLVAVRWIGDVMLGSVATSVAVLAVAALGAAALTGRVELRRAGGVVLGVFLILGARALAEAVIGLSDEGDPEVQQIAKANYPAATERNLGQDDVDPYAGAAPSGVLP